MDDPAPAMRDYATIWRASEKIVFSTTLTQVSTARTRIEREFDPEAVRALKDAADTDLGIGGPHIAARGAEGRPGRRDRAAEVTGRGRRRQRAALPDGMRIDLELLDERRFGNGVVYLRYRTL